VAVINHESVAAKALSTKVIEKDIKFQSPLLFLDQPALYIHCLRVAITQLGLVRQVLKTDHDAALKVTTTICSRASLS
jgi:hypothetical protein